ncbi:sulfurtransferase TusA family protein [Vibrio sp. SCSIO 43136]|uniref:sulfurtransferase TusA family protein n=1 Tax=Vibrio sp. SCSIO 43136 TaxID=2819101 RepID=UPI0020760AEE|nr:sulfurtransferase TusA family protein [Vibrio sp. SCSIO 43136]USD65943.1 sulfurtransferase TusA family protein [Vibrio sp. SCSIO 43136]
MTSTTLDLRQHQCPMSLLLMKRAVVKLADTQRLTIYVSDAASVHDMIRFLDLHPYSYGVDQQKTHTVITVERLSTHV